MPVLMREGGVGPHVLPLTDCPDFQDRKDIRRQRHIKSYHPS